MKYTVRQATATGKVDEKYGAEYIVHFNEDDREVKMSRQKAIEVGQEENGTIMENKFGAYFKKDPYNPDLSQGANPVKKEWTPMKRDNSDGMRQGMCINNAANQVAAAQKVTGKVLGTDVWADVVFEYAQALYAKGDLKMPETLGTIDLEDIPVIDVNADTAPSTVKDLFGVTS